MSETALTDYLTITTKTRYEIRDITEHVERVRSAANLWDGFVLVSTMHITSSIFVNDHEPGLWRDILEWVEKLPPAGRHYAHPQTGADNDGAARKYPAVGRVRRRWGEKSALTELETLVALIRDLLVAIGRVQATSFIRRLQREARERGIGRETLSSLSGEGVTVPASLSDLGKRLIGALSAANFIVVTAPDHIEVREVPGDDLLARMIM